MQRFRGSAGSIAAFSKLSGLDDSVLEAQRARLQRFRGSTGSFAAFLKLSGLDGSVFEAQRARLQRFRSSTASTTALSRLSGSYCSVFEARRAILIDSCSVFSVFGAIQRSRNPPRPKNPSGLECSRIVVPMLAANEVISSPVCMYIYIYILTCCLSPH